jgi:holo-[acyl-carrier protein] synthase
VTAGPPVPPGTLTGVGVDAVDVERLRRALRRRPALAERLFTEAERAYAGRAADPGPRLAARFAAKEAVAKALKVGIGAVSWRDVEVVRDDAGAPGLSLAGGAAALSSRRGVGAWHLSLTHTDALAVAVVVAVPAAGEAETAGPAGAAER